MSKWKKVPYPAQTWLENHNKIEVEAAFKEEAVGMVVVVGGNLKEISRVEEHPEFDTTIKNDPIKLLEVIKVLMHDPVCAQYPMISMTDALTRLINAKQAENEGLKTDTDKKNYKDEAFEAWMAYLLIRGSDQNKYGSLTKNFISQYSLGNDQYPRTITMATDVLSNHRLDPKFFENQKRHREQHQQQHQYKSDGEITGVASFAQKDKDVTCFICGKAGHRSPNLRIK
ncbi:MAG: hypothetical protein ACP5P1_15815, partial [Acidimicrobiales bacterium]